jgi:hypothetical protein
MHLVDGDAHHHVSLHAPARLAVSSPQAAQQQAIITTMAITCLTACGMPATLQVPRPEGRKTIKRQIHHPMILNESVQEVAAQVAVLQVGECCMHPSVKGLQQLGLTVKLHEVPGPGPEDPPLHIIKHYDIKEVGRS